MNNLAPMKNCPGGVQGNLNWMLGYKDERLHSVYMGLAGSRSYQSSSYR